MERLGPIEHLVGAAALGVSALRFVKHQFTDAGWTHFPPLPQAEFTRPQRVVRIPENIILGEE